MSDWCTYDDGIYFLPYQFTKLIIDALYESMSIGLATLQLLGANLTFRFPSGWSPKILINGNLQDFRLSNKKFWAIQWYFGDSVFTPPIPLLKEDLRTVWQSLMRPIDYFIPGTENSQFYDFSDDTYKLGTEFSTQRQYGVLSDGLIDVGTGALIAYIVNKLYQLGLHTIVINFIRKVAGIITKRRAKVTMNTIRDLTSNINHNVIDYANVEALTDAELLAVCKQISNRIGVRTL